MVTVQRSAGGSTGLPLVGGALTALALLMRTAAARVPRIGSCTWRPGSAAEVRESYAVHAGAGTLDLSRVPLAPGGRIRCRAEVVLGELTVIVPPEARLEVHGRGRMGELLIDHKVHSGLGVRVERVVPPAAPGEGEAATIELHLAARIGDVVVRRAA